MRGFLTEWGGLAGAIVSIFTFLGTVLRPILNVRKDIASIKASDELQTARLSENYLEILRIKMFSDSIPLAERVDSGKKYTAAGGNGSAEIQHAKNCDELARQVRGG